MDRSQHVHAVSVHVEAMYYMHKVNQFAAADGN
jgi:hypothetical protein